MRHIDGKKISIQKLFHNEDNKHWTGVFEEYSICTDRFIRVIADQYKDDNVTDAPYWNNERTNIGMFAAACWKNGWVALEEYGTEKRKDDNSQGAGRCDLWVSSQDGKINYAIEAKKGHCSLDSKELIKKLDDLLGGNNNSRNTKSACYDAQKLSVDEGDNRMGLVFMHLYLKNSNIAILAEDVIKNVEKYSKSDNGPNFLYIYLKDNGVTSDNGSLIPGVIIAGKNV